MNRKPVMPKARFTPIPPRRLNDDTETAIRVSIKAEIGILHLLCLTNRWLLLMMNPLTFHLL